MDSYYRKLFHPVFIMLFRSFAYTGLFIGSIQLLFQFRSLFGDRLGSPNLAKAPVFHSSLLPCDEKTY